MNERDKKKWCGFEIVAGRKVCVGKRNTMDHHHHHYHHHNQASEKVRPVLAARGGDTGAKSKMERNETEIEMN